MIAGVQWGLLLPHPVNMSMSGFYLVRVTQG